MESVQFKTLIPIELMVVRNKYSKIVFMLFLIKKLNNNLQRFLRFKKNN